MPRGCQTEILVRGSRATNPISEVRSVFRKRARPGTQKWDSGPQNREQGIPSDRSAHHHLLCGAVRRKSLFAVLGPRIPFPTPAVRSEIASNIEGTLSGSYGSQGPYCCTTYCCTTCCCTTHCCTTHCCTAHCCSSYCCSLPTSARLGPTRSSMARRVLNNYRILGRL